MARWTEENHKIIIGILTMVILVFLGMYIKDLSIAPRVTANESGITANAVKIKHVQEMNIEADARMEKTLNKHDTKLDTRSDTVIRIQTIMEENK